MHITKLLNQYTIVINGKKRAGHDTAYEESIIMELEKLKNDGNRII